MSELKTYQEKLSASIENAIQLAVNQYSEFASKIFDYAEKVEYSLKQLSIKPIRQAHDEAIGKVSASCNDVYLRINHIAEDAVDRVEKIEIPAISKSKPEPKSKRSKYY